MIPLEVKHDGERLTNRTVRDIHSDLTAALKNARLWDSLDYFEISLAMKQRQRLSFPNFEWLSCSPVTGAGGDYYIYVGTVLRGRYSLIFVGKTCQGFQPACEVANLCADLLRA
jgi:hypothetical protein